MLPTISLMIFCPYENPMCFLSFICISKVFMTVFSCLPVLLSLTMLCGLHVMILRLGLTKIQYSIESILDFGRH